MDIQSLVKQYAPALVQQLTSKAGFTQQQAQDFVPGLLEKVLGSLKGGGLDVKTLLAGEISPLLSKLDLGGLAKKAGIDQAKAEAGAKQVVPSFLKQLQSRPEGLQGLLGELAGVSAGGEGMLKKASKLSSTSH